MIGAKLRTILMFGTVTGIVMTYQACGQHERFRGQNPNMQLQQQQQGGTSTDNPKPTVDVNIAPVESTGVPDARLCVKEVRFSKPSPVTLSATSVQSKGKNRRGRNRSMASTTGGSGHEVTVSREGSHVDSVRLTSNEIQSVEVDLNSECAGSSLALQSPGASVSTSEPLTLRFEGQATTVTNGASIFLNIEPILKALSAARTPAEIRAVVTTVAGTF